MIALIPYQKFEIKTRFSQNVTVGKVAVLVESRQIIRRPFSKDHKPFEGEIEGFTFKISRIIHYRNNFLPILVGQIEDDLDATKVKITARPNLLASILLPGFLLAPIFLTIFADETVNVGLFWLIYAGIYIAIVASFNFELNKAKKVLNKQLEVDSFSMPK
ncbi:hypothetical protein [Candidatus Leptofilum sp.]|uniref:hypothetical protein n=1 Tax=Candidatus Leptofilum sp. TaxID=3241576 RepID=UPI003B59500B